MVVVVVPPLPKRDEGEPEVVAGVVAGNVALRSYHVGQGVDEEGAVVEGDRAPEEADDQAGPAGDQQTPHHHGEDAVEEHEPPGRDGVGGGEPSVLAQDSWAVAEPPFS